MSSARVRRVLHSDDPRGDDYREAQEWVRDVRSRLAHLRGELEDIARIEAISPHDSVCNNVAGALTLALIALYKLVDGEQSFAARAERTDALWKQVAADPDGFVIEPGADWDWRPHGIFTRGGRPPGAKGAPASALLVIDAADRLAGAVAELIRRGALDSRSLAGDALLDYDHPNLDAHREQLGLTSREGAIRA